MTEQGPAVVWWPHGFGFGFGGLLGVAVSSLWQGFGWLAEAGCLTVRCGFVLVEVVYG